MCSNSTSVSSISINTISILNLNEGFSLIFYEYLNLKYFLKFKFQILLIK